VGLGCSISFFVMKISSKIFSLLLTWLLIQPVVAQPPSLVNFRGQLLDNSNQPVTDTVTVGLKIFSSETGGTALYTEEIGSIEVRNGQYAFQFGAAGSPDFAGVIQANAETWVEVSINNIPLSRQRFVSVPYALNAGSAPIASGAVTRDMLSQEVLNDINRTQISNGSIRREMLDADLRNDLNFSAFQSTHSLSSLFMPYGYDGEPVIGGNDYIVPEGKVLVILDHGLDIHNVGIRIAVFDDSSHHFVGGPGDIIWVDQNKRIVLGSRTNGIFYPEPNRGFVGLLFDSVNHVTPVHAKSNNYSVPEGSKLVVTSIVGTVEINSTSITSFLKRANALVFNAGVNLELNEIDGDGLYGFSGYLIDENRSLGGGLISSEGHTSASNSVTPSMLSDSILKYLMPEIVEQPTFADTIRNGTSVELKPGVEGKYISYQWYKNGEPIDGATSQLFTIESFDVGYHDGNYTVVASNDFGEIESAVIELAGNSNDFRGVDISSMDFQDQNLFEALFDSTTIFSNGTSGASFSGTGVKLDNLSGSIDLRGVNLDSADLRGSDLSQALFNDQTFITSANLSGTGAVFPVGVFDLTGSNVAGVEFEDGSQLTISSDTILTEYDEESEKYNGADIGFSNVNWSGSPDDFRGVNLTGVELDGLDLPNLLFDSDTKFSNGTEGAQMSSGGISGQGVNLSSLSGIIDLRGVFLSGANLSGLDFKINDQTIIEAANLTNVNLCGKDLRQAFQYGANSNTYSNTYYDAETVFPDDFDPAQEPGLVFVSDSFTVGGGQLNAPYFIIDNDQGIVDFTSYKLRPGNTYSFRSWEIAEEHSFMIGESYGDMESSLVYRGPLTRGNEGSFMFLTVPEGFDGSLFYFCPNHSSMVQEFTLSPANHIADLNSTVRLEMIWVEPGTFTMGSPESEAFRSINETQHEVTLTTGFYLGKYEVTQAQYEAVMTGNTETDSNGNVISATPSQYSGNPDRPVEKVSWDDIQVFLTRLNAQEADNIPAGWAYVLPSEAQWEYACRAGTTTVHSWGDSITASDANYYHNSPVNHTTDVGSYGANPWGFFDMHGNVHEWTADASGTYVSGAQTDPFNEGATGSYRVHRGGSWSDGYYYLGSARRYNQTPSYRSNFIGFRVGFQQIPADVASPEMQIFGDANITHLQDTPWVDPGVEAHDVRDGNITSDIVVTGSVDVNTTGMYILTYSVTDAAGNEVSLTRTVNVVEPSQPSSHVAELNSTVRLEMIWVEPGTFMMGSPETETGRADDEILHEVTLSQGYYLGKYEVTQGQYEAVTGTNPSNWDWMGPNNPLEQIRYNEIPAFLSTLNEMQRDAGKLPAGWEYVLPTEAEWEYACRAGTSTAYHWGNDIDEPYARYNSGTPVQVGTFEPNPWGFYDMHGNVSEWVLGLYSEYPNNPVTDPVGSDNGTAAVNRGGNFSSLPENIRSAWRREFSMNRPSWTLGFRLALKAVPDTTPPEITILSQSGDWPSYNDQGGEFPTFSYSAIDNVDGDLTDQVEVSNGFDSGLINGVEEGWPVVTFTITDSAGNTQTHTEIGPSEIIGFTP
jgi:formylglycine-generating enzyme required for sulfatase activity/uncharacterized protein YjbI with pentapeptide repeats